MILTNKLTSDSACRMFFNNDTHFSSFCNAVLFNGKQLIDALNLIHFENDSAVIINDTKKAGDKKRRRDIIVRGDIHGVYCLFGVEHQSTIDKEMVIRCGMYEMVEYLKQVKKGEKVIPQVMIIFYTGDKKWNVPVKLSDYFDIPEELKEYVNDWKIKVVDVKEIDTSKIKDEQTRYFIEAIQEMYKGNYEGLHREIKMNRDNFIYAAIITGSIDLIRNLPEGDEIDMCEGMERMAEAFRSEGKLEEKRSTLKEQLEIKLGNISNDLELKLTNTTLEKLNILTRNIFNITNEEDVLKIIN